MSRSILAPQGWKPSSANIFVTTRELQFTVDERSSFSLNEITPKLHLRTCPSRPVCSHKSTLAFRQTELSGKSASLQIELGFEFSGRQQAADGISISANAVSSLSRVAARLPVSELSANLRKDTSCRTKTGIACDRSRKFGSSLVGGIAGKRRRGAHLS